MSARSWWRRGGEREGARERGSTHPVCERATNCVRVTVASHGGGHSPRTAIVLRPPFPTSARSSLVSHASHARTPKTAPHGFTGTHALPSTCFCRRVLTKRDFPPSGLLLRLICLRMTQPPADMSASGRRLHASRLCTRSLARRTRVLRPSCSAWLLAACRCGCAAAARRAGSVRLAHAPRLRPQPMA